MKYFSRIFILSGAAFAVSISNPAFAKEAKPPLVLMPASDWYARYENESCRLARIFGEGDNKSFFYIERYEPGDNFYLMVAGRPLKGMKPGIARFVFGPDGQDHESGMQSGTFGDYGPALTQSFGTLAPLSDKQPVKKVKKKYDPALEAADIDKFDQKLTEQQEAAINYLEIRYAGKAPVRLQLGSMGKAMKAMRACTDEMITHWGLDLEAHRSMTRAAAPSDRPSNWLTPNDYPVGLMAKGIGGVIQFRLIVGIDGKPTDCIIQQSTRPAEFDKTVCRKLMLKARFTPALDAGGKPMVSYWRNAVSFWAP